MGGSLKRKGRAVAAEPGSEEDADSDYEDSDVEDESEEEGGSIKRAANHKKKRGRPIEEEQAGKNGAADSGCESSDFAEDNEDGYDDIGKNDGGGVAIQEDPPPSPAVPKISPLRKLQLHFVRKELDDVYLRQMLEQWGSVPLAKEKIDSALAVATELSKDFASISLSYLVRAIAETNGTLEAAHSAVSADILTPKVGDLISQSWGDESNPFWRVGKVLHRRKGKGDWFKVEFETEEEEEEADDRKDKSEECAPEILEVQLPLLQKGVTWNLMS